MMLVLLVTTICSGYYNERRSDDVVMVFSKYQFTDILLFHKMTSANCDEIV